MPSSNGINFTGLIVIAAIVLIAFILGRCNGYNGSDEERLKTIDKLRIEDSIRAVETQKAKDYIVTDSIEARRLVDSVNKADKKAETESETYIEQERIYNKKIKHEIQNSTNTDAERIARIRFLLAKQRQLKQRQYERGDTAAK